MQYYGHWYLQPDKIKTCLFLDYGKNLNIVVRFIALENDFFSGKVNLEAWSLKDDTRPIIWTNCNEIIQKFKNLASTIDIASESMFGESWEVLILCLIGKNRTALSPQHNCIASHDAHPSPIVEVIIIIIIIIILLAIY